MFKKIFSNDLRKSGIILFTTMNFFFFLNFLFHVIMARQLGPVNYGIFAVLMTIIYIYAAPTEAIQHFVSRHTSKFILKKEYGKLKFFIIKSLKKGFKGAFIFFMISIIISVPLSFLLKINFWLIILTNLMIFSSFSLPIVRGVLQGRKKFALLGESMIIESISKIILAIVLIFLGLNVFGAIYGVLFGTLISFIFSLEINKNILKTKEIKENFEKIKLESIPYFISMSIILLIFGLDIILAKIFFNAELAGKYAVLSMLGKMVYFGTTSIGKTMFPFASEKKDKNENPGRIFKKALLTVVVLCGGVILIYGIFSNLVVSMVYGKNYLDIAPYIIYSALAFSFLSLSNLFLIYKLSTDQLKKSGKLFIFLILEIVLLFLYHGSILEYIIAFMVSNIIMFIGILILFRK